MDNDTRVLIAGGSLVGLSTALFLSHHGVPCLVVERNPTTTKHPGFRGIGARSMELYRSAGIEPDIWAVTGEQQRAGSVARGRNLADPDLAWMELPWDPGYEHLSPCEFCTCDQDRLEPVLVEQATRRGAEISFGTDLVDFSQDDAGIRVTVRRDGAERMIHADYLVGADGPRGPVREWLGIGQSGDGVLEYRLNVLFETDLPATLQGRKLTGVLVSDINGSLVPRETMPWLLSVPYRPEDGERVEDFTDERCLELIRAGAGRSDFSATIVAKLPWRSAALLADRFRAGRAFLVGDAAHVMPPPGAFGGNTGIHDAHNLAWKLAAVLNGSAQQSLLDTYEAERRPIIEATVAEALGRMRSWFKLPGAAPPPRKPLDDNTVMFGYRYHGPGVVPEDSDAELFEDPRHPTARPGSRAPHVWLSRGGERLSTLDLFGTDPVVLTGPAGSAWQDAANQIGLTCHRIGGDALSDVDGQWAVAYGVKDDGAVLVRPDGFVAWRSTVSAGEPAETLRMVLGRVLG